MDAGETQGVESHAVSPQPSTEPRSGLRLGRYELVSPIASGGMATVWMANAIGDYGFKRSFAIKMIRREFAGDPTFRSMFLSEAKLAARIRHVNVLEIVDLGEIDSLVYQVMPFVEGHSLAGALHICAEGAKGPMPIAVAVRILSDALRGLHAAHQARDENGEPLRLVHRDVSPQNILVGIDGSTKISDFGIAKAMADWSAQTEGTSVKGKPAYLSPEQLRGEAVDRRADIFAAGIVLWETLAGKTLFAAPEPVAIVSHILVGAVPDPRTHRSDIPEAIVRVVMRALEKDRAARFSTAEEMADALERAAKRAGFLGSTRDVAAFMESFASRLSAPPLDDSASTISTLQPPLSATIVSSKSGAPPRRAPPYWLGAVALLVVGGVGVLVRYRPTSSPSTPTTPASNIPAPVAVAAPPPDLPPQAPPAASTAPLLSASAVSSASRFTPPLREPAPRASARAPQLQFSNPYAR